MAIKVPYDIYGLVEIAENLEIIDDIIPSRKNGGYAAEDLIIPIRNYYLTEYYESLENVPDYLQAMLSLKSPMLARRIDSLKDEAQDEIRNSDDFDYEEKLNGMRAITVFGADGIEVFSRHSSVDDLLPVELGDKISDIVKLRDGLDIKIKHSGIFMLDAELDLSEEDVSKMKEIKIKQGNKYVPLIGEEATKLQAITSIMNSTPERALEIQNTYGIQLKFNIFDCMYYKGHDIRGLDLRRRRNAVKKLVEEIGNYLHIAPIRSAHGAENKEKLLTDMILEGKEGIVAKNVNSTYRSDGNRGPDDWIKIKPSIQERMRVLRANKKKVDIDEDEQPTFGGDLGIGFSFSIPGASSIEETPIEKEFKDTFDTFVTGFNPGNGEFEGLVGSLELSTYIVKSDETRYLHHIATVSGFGMELRKKITDTDEEGNVILKSDFYNTVIEVDGQGISHVNKRLNHARFIDIRYDKDPMECEVDEEFLDLVV